MPEEDTMVGRLALVVLVVWLGVTWPRFDRVGRVWVARCTCASGGQTWPCQVTRDLTGISYGCGR